MTSSTKVQRLGIDLCELNADLLGAAATIADLGEHVVANGPELTYATAKFGLALFKASEALALCDVSLRAVLENAERGHRRGLWLRGRHR